MSVCGCGRCPQCRGLQTSTPSRRALDPLTPGGRRAARWVDARASMWAGLSGQVIDGGRGIPSLRTRTADDPVIALTDAAAVVVDVLDFYTDRLGRESALGTAAQADSIDYLGRAVGYRASPGVVAETVIAFDVEPIARTGDVPPSVIPVGTRIMNSPGPGERSVTFETVESLTARPEWNTLTVARWGAGRVVDDDKGGSVRIRGLSVPVSLGDALLVETDESSWSRGGYYVTVTKIEPIPEQQVTVLSWSAREQIGTAPAGVVYRHVSLLGPSVPAFVQVSQQWKTISVEAGRIRAGVGARIVAVENARWVLIVTGRAESVWTSGSPPKSWVPFTQLTTNSSGTVDLDKTKLSVRDVLMELPLAANRLDPMKTPIATIDVEGVFPADALPRRIVLRVGDLAAEAIVDEAASLSAFAPDGTSIPGTQLTLREPLAIEIDPHIATVRANVAAASHGESKSVILGSGDASLAGQSFPVPEVPIASIREPDGVHSTLSVRVNGVRWQERPSFWGARPDDRIYVVETAVDGKTQILFGDWVSGSGLPDGNNNVVAALRIGCDPADGPSFSPGNVRSGALTTLVDRPLGVVSCVNHVPAVGGVDPPTPAERRTRTPIGLRAFKRAVSPIDYVDLALAEAGVAKARVDVLGGPGSRRVVVTVAGVGARPGEIGPFQDLKGLTAVLRSAGDPLVPLTVVNYHALTGLVSALLRVEADHDPQDVQDRARLMLKRRFSASTQELGASVHESEIIQALHGLASVSWVQVQAYVFGQETLHVSHGAIEGHGPMPWQGGQWRGASLLSDIVTWVDAVPVEDLLPERGW